MTLKDRFRSLPPFSQVILLVLIGAVSFFLSNIGIAVIIQSFYSEVDFSDFNHLIEHHPSLYMVMSFLPFQLGFLLIPGILYYFYLKENKNLVFNFNGFNWIWSIFLFISVLLLLPFFSEINHFITKAFGIYDYLYDLKESTDEVMQTLLYDADLTTYITGVLLIGLMAGVAEELIFRGFLFHHLLKTTNKLWLSITASGFIFALLHFNYFQFIPLIVFGIVLAIIYHISKSLIPGIILHAANNALNVYWIKTDSFPKWMEFLYLEITIPSTLLLMGLIYIKRSNLNLSK